MSEQIAAHERYLRLRADFHEALDHGDTREAAKLRPQVERAKREWHQLARAVDDAMRDTRPRTARER